jgi:DNA-binding CsgD family transcriptional regulator
VAEEAVMTLTDRDVQALRLLAVGRSTAQISDAMLMSTNTTRARIRRLQGKLGAADRHAVVRAARGIDPSRGPASAGTDGPGS